MTPLTTAQIRALPKVALHDHLDGGLRPATVLELEAEAARDGVTAPPTAAGIQDTAAWFQESASAGSLVSYLQTFDRTVALLQSAANLRRVAREFVLDMAADGVIYAETRWAPEQHLDENLSVGAAIDAVQAGLDEGMQQAQDDGAQVTVRQIISLLRQNDPRDDIVEEAVRRVGSGVVGLDLAGPELGFPASRFRRQLDLARDGGLRLTIHAGEADGLDSILDALDCGAERLGHGVRLVDDITASGRGEIAERVHREGVTLEVCPTSNLQTGAFADPAAHPTTEIIRHGIRVAISCDNRLMGRTDLTQELSLLVDHHGWGREDILRASRRGAEAAFCDEETRGRLLERIDED